MGPRFLERIELRTQANNRVFGRQPRVAPPPYSASISSCLSISYSNQLDPPPKYLEVDCPRVTPLERFALPDDSLVLVTGASGWQGIHVVDQLLLHGFRVRGSVVNDDSASRISAYVHGRYGTGRFTAVIVPDMASRSAFDAAVEGCSGVVHCASVAVPSSDPTQVITPSIAGAINALEAAHKESRIKRFVYCSSTVAAVGPGNGTRTDVTSDSWNMSVFLPAWQPPPYTAEREWAVHASSKLQTEQAVWRWHRDRKPSFTLNTVLPAPLCGKLLDSRLPASIDTLKTLNDSPIALPDSTPPHHFIDVQDSALLHVAALLLPEIENQRIFAVTSPSNVNALLPSLQTLYPHRVLACDVEHGTDGIVFVEADRAEELLRRMGRKGFTGIETSMRRTCDAFL